MGSRDSTGFDLSLVDPQLTDPQVLDHSNDGLNLSTQKIDSQFPSPERRPSREDGMKDIMNSGAQIIHTQTSSSEPPLFNGNATGPIRDRQTNRRDASLHQPGMIPSDDFGFYQLGVSNQELQPSARPLDGTQGSTHDMKSGDANFNNPGDSVCDEQWAKWFAVRDPYPIYGISGCLNESDSNRAPERDHQGHYNIQPADGDFQSDAVVEEEVPQPNTARCNDQRVESDGQARNTPQSRYSARDKRTFDQMHHNGEENETIAAALNRTENAIAIRRNRIYGNYASSHASDAARAQNGPIRAPRIRRQASKN